MANSFDEIFDVSAVIRPAFPETDLSIRARLAPQEVDPGQLDAAILRAAQRAGMEPEDSGREKSLVLRDAVGVFPIQLPNPGMRY